MKIKSPYQSYNSLDTPLVPFTEVGAKGGRVEEGEAGGTEGKKNRVRES